MEHEKSNLFHVISHYWLQQANTVQAISSTPASIRQRNYALPSLTAPAPVSLLLSVISSHLDENGAVIRGKWGLRGAGGIRRGITLCSFQFYFDSICPLVCEGEYSSKRRAKTVLRFLLVFGFEDCVSATHIHGTAASMMGGGGVGVKLSRQWVVGQLFQECFLYNPPLNELGDQTVGMKH